MEISNLPNEEFKVMIIMVLTKLGRRIDEYSKNFNKELEKIYIYNQSGLKNAITEMKNTLERINGRLDDTKEHLSDL